MANGKIISYPFGAPPVVYSFEQNYNWKHQPLDYVATDAFARSPNGTLHSDCGALKRKVSLPFEFAPLSQVQAIEAARLTKQPVDLYLDGDQAEPSLTGLIMQPLNPVGQPSFAPGQPLEQLFSFTLEIEEV